jgi:hypothetical protein
VAAPDYVPRPANELVRVYSSPPWRPEEWTADRPADLPDGQPTGAGMAWQGPDQGYVLRLVRQFDGRLVLADGEDVADAKAGCVVVALKRASLFSRAPVVHDLTVAFTVWGFLAPAPVELVTLRSSLFSGVAHEHHHAARHRIAELVPSDVVRLNPAQVTERFVSDWRSLLDPDIDLAATAGHH